MRLTEDQVAGMFNLLQEDQKEEVRAILRPNKPQYADRLNGPVRFSSDWAVAEFGAWSFYYGYEEVVNPLPEGSDEQKVWAFVAKREGHEVARFGIGGVAQYCPAVVALAIGMGKVLVEQQVEGGQS